MWLSNLGAFTLGDARKFDSMYPSDMALVWYNAHTCTVGNGGILRSAINSILWIDRETQIAPVLIDHICRRCEFAMRQNNKSHYLFRFVPMVYEDNWTHISGFLDTNQEELATFCTQWMEQSIFSKIPEGEYEDSPIIQAPLIGCGSFLKRKN